MDSLREKAIQERRFECQKCGFCCSEMALIYPTMEEIRSIASYLNMSEIAFAIRYLREVYDPCKNIYTIAFKTDSPDATSGCVFCQNKLCIIYGSQRTALCNVFPWNHFNVEKGEWDENFVSINGTFWCPGIGKGRLWSLEEINNIKQKYKDLDRRIVYYDVLHIG